MATRSIEEVAEAGPNVDKWFQVYTWRSSLSPNSSVERRLGYTGLWLTVDTAVLAVVSATFDALHDSSKDWSWHHRRWHLHPGGL